MYKNLEPEKKISACDESISEISCYCVCKGGLEEKNSEVPPVDQAALYNVDYYDPGGK